MTATKVRYFFDFVDGQERWLNKMAENGYRLTKCGRLVYQFEACEPGEYEYAVELVGDKPYWEAQEYKRFLEGAGFRTFTKNLNVNLSIGKVKWRPWAKGMGQISTSPGSYNKELLIVERKRDDKPFALHTDSQGALGQYQTLRNAYLWAVGSMMALVAMTYLPGISSDLATWALYLVRGILIVVGILWAIPGAKTWATIRRLKEESGTRQ